MFAPSVDDAVEEADGVRFRLGISPGGGVMLGEGLTSAMAGGELRLGVQIRDFIGVYLTPHFAIGPEQISGDVGTQLGVFAVSADVDLTFNDRLYAGAGVGAAVVTDPVSPFLRLRAGGYPLLHKRPSHRRYGLQIGGDARIFLVPDHGVRPFGELTANVGFEMF